MKISFKALSFVRNQSLPHIIDDFKIAGALINKFFQRLISDTNDSVLIIDCNFKNRLAVENEVETIVNQNDLLKLSSFKKLESDSVLDFPRISLEDIKTNITLGSYQLSQSIG